MKAYLVIIEDHHVDVQVVVFRRKEDAIEYAKDVVEVYEVSLDDIEIDRDDLILFAELSCEGDCVRVEEVDVNEPDEEEDE